MEPSPPVVFDNGTYSSKMGFAGDDAPRLFQPTVVGRPRHQRIMVGMGVREVSVGDTAIKSRGNHFLKHPINRSIVENWDDLEHIWYSCFYDHLRVAPEEQPIILTESPLNPERNREKATQIMLETFNTPKFYAGSTAGFSLLSTGNVTGIALESGHNCSRATPVYEGCAIRYASVESAQLGAHSLTEFFQQSMRGDKMAMFPTWSEMESARDAREKFSYTSFNFDEEMKKVGFEIDPSILDVLKESIPDSYLQLLPMDLVREIAQCHRKSRQMTYPSHEKVVDEYGRDLRLPPSLDRLMNALGYIRSADANSNQIPSESYELPDGIKISLNEMRVIAPEALFQPFLLGLTCPAIQELIPMSIQKCDQDFRSDLLSMVVMSGGTTKTKGFTERMVKEISHIVDPSSIVQNKDVDPRNAAWVGASILGSVSTMKHLWVNREEWEECGPAILHRTCFT